jgi:hypothetical protein
MVRDHEGLVGVKGLDELLNHAAKGVTPDDAKGDRP